jgi:hypothetical protein
MSPTYLTWRTFIFNTPANSEASLLDLPPEAYALNSLETLNYINRILADPEIHQLYSKHQIGVGLNLLYSNACSNFVLSYLETPDDALRAQSIANLSLLYTHYFDRYCTTPIASIGNHLNDGPIGFLCYMFWDISVLHPGNTSPQMREAALKVMSTALHSPNAHSVISAIHGLGHWVHGAPEAAQILTTWLKQPQIQNEAILDYAHHATTGCIQ